MQDQHTGTSKKVVKFTDTVINIRKCVLFYNLCPGSGFPPIHNHIHWLPHQTLPPIMFSISTFIAFFLPCWSWSTVNPLRWKSKTCKPILFYILSARYEGSVSHVSSRFIAKVRTQESVQLMYNTKLVPDKGQCHWRKRLCLEEWVVTVNQDAKERGGWTPSRLTPARAKKNSKK